MEGRKGRKVKGGMNEGKGRKKRRVGNEVDDSHGAHDRHDENDHPCATHVAPNHDALCCPNARTKCLMKGGMERMEMNEKKWAQVMVLGQL